MPIVSHARPSLLALTAWPESSIDLARRYNNPLGAQVSEDGWRAETLRARYPAFDLKDVTSAVDVLRVIKTPREIEILKRNGRISAEAIRKAIEITRPGRYEYELEAGRSAGGYLDEIGKTDLALLSAEEWTPAF